MKNRFGRRFIRLKDLREYVVDLDLDTHSPSDGLMEFFEAHGLLTPVCRIQLPPEVVRFFSREQHKRDLTVFDGMPNQLELEAATDFMSAINEDRWSDAMFFGESVHILDEIAPKNAPYIQTEFPSESFTPWKERRVHLYDGKSGPIYSSNDQHAPSFYHYWQIFWLAAILRSGVHIYYPLDDVPLAKALFEGKDGSLKGKSYRSINFEAYHELRELRSYRQHFDATAYYHAYSRNALQVFAKYRDNDGRIPQKHWRNYLFRERDIARQALKDSGLSQDDLISFVGKQCEWWDNARRIGPSLVAEEYKRNINSSIGFLRAATDIEASDIVKLVGRRTGHLKPTLEVIFPDWAEEQRDLTIRSLKHWTDSDLANLPIPFPCSEVDLSEFCNWLESKGLYQYYWHFRRLVDLNRRDDPVHRAASTSEVVGFASLCEMIANEVMIERGMTPRGNTLFPKIRRIFDASGLVDLNSQLNRFGKLVNTKHQTLPQRLSQIARIRTGAAYSPILRTLLSAMVIRNEGTHLGLLQFDHPKVIEMIRLLALAGLMIWKSR